MTELLACHFQVEANYRVFNLHYMGSIMLVILHVLIDNHYLEAASCKMEGGELKGYHKALETRQVFFFFILILLVPTNQIYNINKQ